MLMLRLTPKQNLLGWDCVCLGYLWCRHLRFTWKWCNLNTFPLCTELLEPYTCSYTFLPWAPSAARHAPNALLSFCCDLHSGKQAYKFSASWYWDALRWSVIHRGVHLLQTGCQVGKTATEHRKQELFCTQRIEGNRDVGLTSSFILSSF